MTNWKLYCNDLSKRFEQITDEELVETFNEQVGCAAWVTARMYYLHCLRNEIRNRKFNSDILFEFDDAGKTRSFKLSKKVKLLKGKLVFSR